MILRVNLSLTQFERDAADHLAIERGVSRSKLIADLIVEASPEGQRKYITSQRLPAHRPRGGEK